MRFNINDDIQCVLTEKGEDILKERNPLSYEYNYNPETRTLKEQLWALINIFGREFYLGGPQIIVKNIIDIPEGQGNETGDI